MMGVAARQVHFISFGPWQIIKFNIQSHFLRFQNIYMLLKKFIVAALIVFSYHSPAAILVVCTVLQIIWIWLLSGSPLKNYTRQYLSAMVGEGQLLLSEFLISYILIIDKQIQSQESAIIDQNLILKKVRIGWLVIILFLLQNAIMMVQTLKDLLPNILYVCRLVFVKIPAEIYRGCVYYKWVVPVKFLLMTRYPFLFQLTRSHREFQPIKQKLEEFNQAIAKIRSAYHDHFSYKMELQAIIALPAGCLSDLLLKQALFSEIIQVFDYTIIINNLNPQTLCYEKDEGLLCSSYAWVSHESFGKPMSAAIKDIFHRTLGHKLQISDSIL